MSKNIALIQGHPDLQTSHYLHALADAYAQGASEAGHHIKIIKVADLNFPLLKSKTDFETGEPVESILEAQEIIDWANHLVIFYPLWLGEMPALLKGFMEQLFRPKFVFGSHQTGKHLTSKIKGKTAHIVITMGMPGFIYRWYYGAHGLKSLKRNILEFCGISPTKDSLIGMIDALSEAKREKWIKKLQGFGYHGK